MLAAGLGLGLGLLFNANLAPTSAMAQDAETVCADDVMRLCAEFVPDRGPIARCMMKRRASVSPACRAVFSKPKASLRKRRG
jgi:hypothetical protein